MYTTAELILLFTSPHVKVTNHTYWYSVMVRSPEGTTTLRLRVAPPDYSSIRVWSWKTFSYKTETKLIGNAKIVAIVDTHAEEVQELSITQWEALKPILDASSMEDRAKFRASYLEPITSILG